MFLLDNLQVYLSSWFSENSEIFIRLFLAFLLGAILGKERGKLNRPAGARTHSLVCGASALVMILGLYLSREGYATDVARLSAQVISGIGFLGAGAILKDGFSVKGLTTATTLWAVACLGLVVGAGYYSISFVFTFIAYLILTLLGNKSFQAKYKYVSVVVKNVDNVLENAKILLVNNGIHISEVSIMDTNDKQLKELRFFSTVDRATNVNNLIVALMKIEGVDSVSFN